MDSRKRLIIAGIVFFSMCLMACGKRQVDNASAYGNIVGSLGDEKAYAFLVMNTDCNVLVTSDLVYDAGGESQASICCDVYYYFDGEAKNLGSINSGGTAYPVCFSEDGIFSAGGHSVQKYTVSEKDGILHLVGMLESFDEDGNASYTRFVDSEEENSSEEEYQKLWEEYTSAQIVHFSYGSNGCLNEIGK